MIEYPSSFPRSARDKVETAIAKAEMDFAANQCTLVLFVLGIFEVFLWEFTEVVFNDQPEHLSAEVFRRDTRQFLDRLIEQAHADKPSSAPDRLNPPSVSHPALNENFDTFRARVLRRLAEFPFWAQHQQNIQILSLDAGEASDMSATDVEGVEPAPPKIAWENAEMRFLNVDEVQVTVGGFRRPPQRFADLGFTDKKTKKANSAWRALQEFARRNGTISRSPP